MRQIRNTLLAARTIGVFLFILISALIIIGLSIFNIFGIDAGITAIDEQSRERFVLESIEYYILDQELAERRYLAGSTAQLAERPEVVACGEGIQPVGNTSQPEVLFAVAECNLNLLMTEYRSLAPSQASVELIEEERATIREDYVFIINNTAPGSLEEDREEIDAIFRAEAAINHELDNLVFENNIAIEEAIDDLAANDRQATVIGFLGLLVFPLLAVWAFLVVARLTRPLLTFKNVVIAIGGGHYTSSLLDDTTRRADIMGDLAHALEDMAHHVEQREHAAQQEIDDLNKEYNRLRRTLSRRM